jgi:hypothetical protein
MNKRTKKNNLSRTSYLIQKTKKNKIHKGGAGTLKKIPALILYNYENPGWQVLPNNDDTKPNGDTNLKTLIHNIHDYHKDNNNFVEFNIGNNVNLVSSNYALKDFEKDNIYYPQLDNGKEIHITDKVPAADPNKAGLYRKDIFLYNGIFIGENATLNNNCTLIPMFTKYFSEITNKNTKYDDSKNPNQIFYNTYGDYKKVSKIDNKYKDENKKVLTPDEISSYEKYLINYQPIWKLPEGPFNNNDKNLFIKEKNNYLHHGIILISEDTKIGENTNIYHSVFIDKKCNIGNYCTICPHTLILFKSSIDNNITFENKYIKNNPSDIKEISTVSEKNNSREIIFNMEFKIKSGNFNMNVTYQQDNIYNPFKQELNRINEDKNKEIWKQFLSCKSVILGNNSKIINKKGKKITILSPFVIDAFIELIIDTDTDIELGPGLIFQNNSTRKNLYQYNIKNSINNTDFNEDKNEFLLFKKQDEVDNYRMNNLNTSNNLNNLNNLNNQIDNLSREDIRYIKNKIPSCRQLNNFDKVLRFDENKYKITDKDPNKIKATIKKLNSYYKTDRIQAGGVKKRSVSTISIDTKIKNIERIKGEISKCQFDIEEYLDTKVMGHNSISMGTTITPSTDLSKLSSTYLLSLPPNVYSSLTPFQQSYISSLQSNPSLNIQPSQTYQQSSSNTISQGQIGRDQLFNLFKNSSNTGNKSRNVNNNLNNTTKGIEDTDIKTQLEESKNTIKSLIQKFGKPSLASDSYYQRKLEKVDESLGRLILLEEDVQEYKLGKDKFKDLVGDFSYIVEDMKRDLKDKQLMDSTKKLHEELLQDKDISKVYKEKLEISEGTLLKKINKVVSRGGDIKEFNDEFRDIMGSFKLDTIQNLFINLINKEYGSSINKTEITSVCRFLDFFEKYTSVENKNFSQKINNIRQNVLKCHGNINKQKGDKKNNRRSSGKGQGQRQGRR